MAAVYTSFDIVGKQEDISDIISNISPTKTPFTSATGSETCDNTLFQWQEDSLRSVSSTNYQVEGFTATPTARTPTVMRSNLTQILQETFQVAGTTDRVKKYGRASETAYQAGKAMAALKRDLENVFVGTAQTKVTPGDNTTARQMSGYQDQIDAGNVVKTGNTNTVVSEANILTLLNTIYTNGADPTIIMVTPTNSQTVADFAKASGRTRQIKNGDDDRSIINVVDLYVSPFGEQKVVLNRFLATGYTLIFDPALWAKVSLRPWFREMLAKTGDNTSQMIVGEYSLKHKNFKASGHVWEHA